jgi:hypothetical protein
MSASALSNDQDDLNNETDYVEISNSISDYQNNIAQLEISAGPHDNALLKPLLSMGILQNENGQFSYAEETLKRALQIHRINKGLHDLSQLPILDLIISNNISQQNWKAVNNNYHLYHWLHKRNYEETDPGMLPVIDKLIAWHLLGTNLKTGPHPGEHFIKLLELNKRALQIVENFPVPDDLEHAKRLYKLALIHYYISIAVQRGEPVGRYLVQKFNPIQNGDSYETTSGQIVKKRFRKSRKLITRIVTLYSYSASATANSEAIALIYLADWDLLFNRHKNAYRGYELAHNKLIESGFSRELVNSFFLQPKLLPKSEFVPDWMVQYASNNIDLGGKPETATEFIGWSTALPGVKFPAAEIGSIVSPSTERYSLVSFNILEDGLTENIRISRDNPENSLPRRTTYDAIWSAQYRPRILDGKTVEVSGMSTRFYLPSIEIPK